MVRIKHIRKVVQYMSKRKAVLNEIFSYVKLIILGVAVGLILNNYVVVNAEVLSGSMENLMKKGDRIMGSRLSYVRGEPERFDVVIFKYPVDESKNYIKRIIGLPGETITIEEGQIYIGDSQEPLKETYLKEVWNIRNDDYTFHVPQDSYLMLGDNRNISADSRVWNEEALLAGVAETADEAESFRYVKKENIVGKAEIRYWTSFEIIE